MKTGFYEGEYNNKMSSTEGDKLFAGPCEFVLGVTGLGQLPIADRPEVAFAGRSNVGKSSLINALTNRKSLARTSNTPGRTQQLNFFDLNHKLFLVDMPGYGYAKVSKTERDAWDKLIKAYLRGRPTLRTTFVLVDSRHGLKDNDLSIMTMLDETAVSYRLVLTKTDKIKRQELTSLTKRIEKTLKEHPAAHPEIIGTSAEKGGGITELRDVIAGFLGP